MVCVGVTAQHSEMINHPLPHPLPRPPRAPPRHTTLQIVVIGRHDLSFEAHSVQDLEALADTELYFGTSEPLACMAQRQNVGELAGGSLARAVPGVTPGAKRDCAMRRLRSTGG